VGRSSIGENLEPRHLVNWTRVAYNADASVPFDDFTGITVTEQPDGPVPGYPQASNLAGAPGQTGAPGETDGPSGAPGRAGAAGMMREQLRALIIEELQQLVRG
jgi:acetaldehyde dehydrogenase/alcohol dehydrogenase